VIQTQLAVAIILIKGDRVLMQLRDDLREVRFPGYWGLPGGSVERGESLEAAVVREMQEETGYTAVRTTFVTDHLYNLPGGKKIITSFFSELYDNSQPIECYEGQKMEFKSLTDLKSISTIPGQVEAIKMSLK
jgi:mutator protein MutT